MESVCVLKLGFRSFIESISQIRNKIIKLKKQQNKNPKTNIKLFEISFSGLKNITLKKKFVLIVVDLEVLEILKSWRHMCGAILFPSIRSTWRNGKESIRGKTLVYGMLNSSFCESYFQLCLFVFALILLPDQLIKTDKP